MLHDVVVSSLWPGDEPIAPNEYRNKQLLGSAMARPFQTAFGQDIHGTIFEKAAALFHSLIGNHPFYNGNKRTAVLALDHFLLANGYFLALSNNEMYAVAKETATYRERGIGHEQMVRHLASVLRRRSISFRKFRKDPSLTKFHDRVRKMRLAVRRHELNRGQRKPD